MILHQATLSICNIALLIGSAVTLTQAFTVAPIAKSLLPNRPLSPSSASKPRSPTTMHLSGQKSPEEKKTSDLTASQILMPWKVDIPDEYRSEIQQAEANTPAGQQRKQRMVFYTSGTLLGGVIAAGNLYLSTVREFSMAPSFEDDMALLRDGGYDWVLDNPVLSFFLLNGIGGGVGLLAFGTFGTMVELEQRSKSEATQDIWDELVRRRESKEAKTKPGKKKLKKKRAKEKKRLGALSEVMQEPPPTVSEDGSAATATTNVIEGSDGSSNETVVEDQGNKASGGFLDKMKGFYEQADSMAASQALLLNKKLEEEGFVEKITDESGLRVIGKEAASKLEEQKDK